MAEDPRDLARRLAEEAKKRLMSTPAAAERSLEERAGSVRTKSAREALEAAREAERQRAATPAQTPPTTNRRATPAPSIAPRAADTASPPSVAPQAPDQIFAAQLPGGRADRIAQVTQLDVFRALWRAHRARALHEGDGGLVATASVLLDALERLPTGRLLEARVTLGNETWAAWIDVDRGVLLGMVRPADVYLSAS